MRFEALLAHRYFRSRKRTGFVSLITWISVGGVSLGVAVLIIALSIQNGLSKELRTRILGTNAALILLRYDRDTFPAADSLEAEVRDVPGVLGAAGFVYGKALLKAGTRSDGVIVKGVDLEAERTVTSVADRISPPVATLDAPEDDIPPVVVGRDLAERLRIAAGDEVVLASPFGASVSPLGFVPRLRKFRVAGIFSSGLYEYDSSLCFISVAEAQRFFRLPGEVTGIEIKIVEPFQAETMKNAVLERLGGYPFRINTWIDLNRNLFAYMRIEKFVLGLILLLIVLVAAFNIVGALVMLVMEKKRDIGILKSMGATDGEVMRIFMTAGSEIGAIGIAMGTLIGVGASLLLDRYRIALPNDVYLMDTVPVRLQPWDVVTVAVVVYLLCWLATLYPAWKAARLDPVEAIREG